MEKVQEISRYLLKDYHKIGFFLGQTILLYGVFLFADSFLKWFFYFIFLCYFLFRSSSFELRVTKSNYLIIVLAFLFLILSLISVYFAKVIPLAIDGYMYLSTSILFFIFKLLSKEYELSLEGDFFSLLSAVIWIQVTSKFLFFQPDIGTKIDGMNLVFSTYGHNHGVVLILAVAPFLYSLAKSKLIRSLMVFAVFVLVLTSFSRLAVVVFSLQIITLYIINKKNESKNVLIFPIFLILVHVIVALYPVVCSSVSVHFSQKICKNFSVSHRTEYWSQAIKAIQEEPLTGFGAGNFSVASNLYKSAPDSSTRFAHNYLLNIGAELGIPALLTIASISALTFLLLLKRKRSTPLEKITLVSLASIYFFFIFDFDFNFFGILLVFICLLSRLLKGLQSEQRTVHCMKSGYLKIPFRIFSVISLFICSMYFAAEVAIFFHKQVVVLKYFPFFLNHKIVLGNYLKTSERSEYGKDFIEVYDDSIGMLEISLLLKYYSQDYVNRRLMESNPMSFVDAIIVKEITPELRMSIQKVVDQIYTHQDHYIESRHPLASKLIQLSLQSDIKEDKVYLLKTAYSLSPWIMHTESYDYHIIMNADFCEALVSLLPEASAEPFGDNRVVFSFAYSNCAKTYSFSSSDKQKMLQFSEKLAPWRKEELSLEFSDIKSN